MDLWVVAAAASAGYIAKYWKSHFGDKEGSSGFPSGNSFPDNRESSSLTQQIHEETDPFRKLSRRKTAEQCFTENGNENNSDEVFSETSRRAETSSSVLDHEKQVEDYVHCNMPSRSIFTPEFRKCENFEECRDDYRFDTWEMGASHGSRRSKNSLRNKRLRLNFIKPRSSLDSCLMAQVYREHSEMEEYLLSPLCSPCTPTFRPFLVTDGRVVINRASGDVIDGLRNTNGEVVGVPRLPRIVEDDCSKQKLNKGKNQMAKSRDTKESMQLDSQGGSSSGQVLLGVGICIGVMCTTIASKVEVDKLNERLKQRENLVQDLQEELEMKDSLTVKELVNDDDSEGTHEIFCDNKNLNSFSNQTDTNVSVKHADEECVNLKKVDSMSKIEAELEAELERLELSMTGSTMQGRLSRPIEFDHEIGQDITAELVHGELKADILQRKSTSEPTPNRGSTSTPRSMKDGVSPRELGLRLYEVVQARLEARITELEKELEKSQKLVRHLESSERINSFRYVSNSESSSTLGSPNIIEVRSPIARPLVMNLSGDALEAYNEAYEELDKVEGSKNEASRVLVDIQNGNLLSNDRENGIRNRTSTWLEGSLNGYDDKDGGDGDGDDDDDDLILIKQIVEKARQGSPALLRAQKAMVSLDRDEHYGIIFDSTL